MIGDPLFTCPMDPDLNLCYEIHGRGNENFNVISDACVSVNSLYIPVNGMNVVGAVGVRAEDSKGMCRNVKVDLDGCTVSAGVGDDMKTLGASERLSMNGITARKTRSDRVRISVPNCNNVKLVMWVICEHRERINMIRFQIARGLNLAPTSHGLLGEL